MWIQFFCPNGTNALLPRIEQPHTRSLKIAPIPRDNGEAVHPVGVQVWFEYGRSSLV
jgi:hypothetical protein